jgi:hypothetical protein
MVFMTFKDVSLIYYIGAFFFLFEEINISLKYRLSGKRSCVMLILSIDSSLAQSE